MMVLYRLRFTRRDTGASVDVPAQTPELAQVFALGALATHDPVDIRIERSGRVVAGRGELVALARARGLLPPESGIRGSYV